MATNEFSDTKIFWLLEVTAWFIPPKMTTTQRDALTWVVEWSVIYNTTTKVLNFYNGTVWGSV